MIPISAAVAVAAAAAATAAACCVLTAATPPRSGGQPALHEESADRFGEREREKTEITKSSGKPWLIIWWTARLISGRNSETIFRDPQMQEVGLDQCHESERERKRVSESEREREGKKGNVCVRI